MIEPSVALEIVLDNVCVKVKEQVSVSASLGRTIADVVISKKDIPCRDVSAMDGYAVQYNDIKGDMPVKLKVLGTIAAGDIPVGEVTANSCYRIMTGGYIPNGADTVVEYENTDNDHHIVTVNKSKKKADNIRPAKDDIAKGAIINNVGETVTPYHQSRFLSVGAMYAWMYSKPRVAIISTGSEVSDLIDYDTADKILDANAPALMGMVSSIGADGVYLGVVPDEEAPLLAKLESAKGFDMIVVSGGISAGDFDYMANIEKKTDLKWHFHTVNQKPGKPVAFGIYKGVPIFGMPGNPVSCMFCAYYYMLPALKKMMGLKQPRHSALTALLGESVKKKKGRNLFDRVTIKIINGTLHAYPYKSQNSNLIDSMIHSNAFMELSGGMEGDIPVGTPVKVYLFNSNGLI